MKIMKKIFKNSILTFVLGAILFTGITAYAAGRYYATQVDYEPENSNFNVDNMADALDQLYTTQNTTISNLNNQITTLTGQVSAKDATISSLQSQLNGISTTDCIKGTFTASSACGTSSGCLVENQFKPSAFMILANNYYSWRAALVYNSSINSKKVFVISSDNGHDVLNYSDYFYTSGSSIYMKNEGPDFQSGSLEYIACR